MRLSSHLLTGVFLGTSVGLLSIGVYLLCGGEPGRAMPDWAFTLFLPGVLAGELARQLLDLEEGLQLLIEVASVGLGYGLLGAVSAAIRLVVRFLWKRLCRGNR